MFNFTDAFDENVVEPYAAAYEAGRTPNPCVECNRTMKFGRVLERAGQLGFDAVMTGHYARVIDTAHGKSVARGRDAAKDQSYVLYMLGAAELARTLLPIGELTKAEVRAHASALGLRTATKAESMDVCFITKGGRESFLGARIARKPGAIVDTAGVQRRRARRDRRVHRSASGAGSQLPSATRRYVVDIEPRSATVTIGEHADLLRDGVDIDDAVWAAGVPPTGPVSAQWRAHGAAVPARLVGRRVVFAEPQPRVAPGQVVALYAGDVVLGGGIAAP